MAGFSDSASVRFLVVLGAAIRAIYVVLIVSVGLLIVYVVERDEPIVQKSVRLLIYLFIVCIYVVFFLAVVANCNSHNV